MHLTKTVIILLVSAGLISCSANHPPLPNIVIILADDMGYGDVQSFNPDSEIPTPHLNKLSEEGIMFMDAHTPSSICTPTRYGLLTGRYCWRSSLKRGVLKGYSPPLIEEDRATIATYLKGKGYQTGIVGKWHLGLGFQKESRETDESENSFDLTKTLYSSPNNYGFDFSYVLPASLDFEPYVYVRNYEVTDTEFDSVSTTRFPHFWRKGIKSRSLEFHQVLDDLLVEAKGFIIREAESKEPFFLYFPLTAPHVPVIPTEKFRGVSGKGPYGDFISQVDWTAGEIFSLLEKLEIEKNTLVIFTSDNGSAMRRVNSSTEPDHVSDERLKFYNFNMHQANGPLRGIKGDTYEGGHRVPFIVRWPAKFSGGQSVNETICLTDIFASIVEVSGGEMPGGSAEDSYSFYPIISGESTYGQRPPVIHHSGGKGMYAIRKEQWKLILGDGSGARTKPVGVPFQQPFQLYNMESDIAERRNLIDQEPEVADKLREEFFSIKGENQSVQ